MAKARRLTSLEDMLAELSSEDRAMVEAEGARLIERELTLRQIREGLGISQTQLADRMGVQQAAVSKAERRAGGISIQMLARQVRAMGGRVSVYVEVPGRSPVRIRIPDPKAKHEVER